MTLFMLSVLD